MPNHNPTRTNYLCNSVDFNPNAFLVNLPHGDDGTIEFAHIPVFPTAFNFSGAFAIEAWVKPSVETLIQSRIIQTPEFGVNNVTNPFMLGLLGDDGFYETCNNALRIGMSTGGSTPRAFVTCDPVLKHNTWHHIVGQRTSSNLDDIEIYVDGCLRRLTRHPDIDYTLDVENTPDPTGLVVGWDASLDAPFKGAMASIVLFNRALTSEEIETLAQGISSLISPKSVLKPNVVAWWQMGDGDPANLSQLLDSVGTNHFTTVNMDNTNLLTDIPKERPRKHQCAHARTGGDELKLDPNGFGSSFLWDSFWSIDDPDNFPHKWFGAKDLNDKFNRVNISGRLSVLNFTKVGDGSDITMFITNIESGAVGNTLTFGNPVDPNPTEYCMEFVARSRSGTAEGFHYIGWIEDVHSYTDPSTEPQTGVFVKWDSANEQLDLIITNGGNVSPILNTTLNNNQFYKIKVCFKYIPTLTATIQLIATLHVNEVLIGTVAINSSGIGSAAFPIGTGDIFIGTSVQSVGTYDFDIVWVNVAHRGIGDDFIAPL